MKTVFIVLFSCFIFTNLAYGDSINIEKVTLDFAIDRINDNSKSIEDKYALTQYIYRLSTEDQITIFEELKDIVKDENDKGKLVTLYAMLDVSFRVQQLDLNERLSRLIKAAEFTSKTKNPDALGAYYYTLGNLYYDLDKIPEAFENFYRAVDYYKQSETKKRMLSFIYYRMGTILKQHNELDKVEQLIPEMLALEFEGKEKIYLTNIYTYTGQYYASKAFSDSVNKYRLIDSAIFYISKSIDAYHKYHEEATIKNTNILASQNYSQLAELQLEKEVVALDSALIYLDQGKKLYTPSDTNSIVYSNLTTAKIWNKKKDYKQAIQYLKDNQIYIDTSKKLNKELTRDTYLNLSLNYSKLGGYKQALDYRLLYEDIDRKLNEIHQFDKIKELDTKYETSQKELQISLLKDEKQQILLTRTITIACLIVLSILLAIGFMYNRLKRYRNEKKALELSKKIEQKEYEFQTQLKESENRQILKYFEGRELERKAIATELHDSIAGDVLAISFMSQKDGNKERINEMLESTYNHIRQISHELMPPKFNYMSLEGLFKDRIDILNQTQNINFSIEIDEEQSSDILNDIPQKQKKEIYYIVQEAISNLCKHSQSTIGKINIFIENKNLMINITDDGKGFDVHLQSQGIGLRTIQERAHNIGVNIEIKSIIRVGTIVSLTYPISLLQDHQD